MIKLYEGLDSNLESRMMVAEAVDLVREGRKGWIYRRVDGSAEAAGDQELCDGGQDENGRLRSNLAQSCIQ